MWDMTHKSWIPQQSYVRHALRLISMRDVTYSYVWCDSSTCVMRLIHVGHDTLESSCTVERPAAQKKRQSWRNKHSYVWHDSFICMTWLIHMCNMTRRSRVALANDQMRKKDVKVEEMSIRLYMLTEVRIQTIFHVLYVFIHTWDPSMPRKKDVNIEEMSIRLYMLTVYAWHDSFVKSETWLLHMRDMMVRSFASTCSIEVWWLIDICGLPYSCRCMTPSPTF